MAINKNLPTHDARIFTWSKVFIINDEVRDREGELLEVVFREYDVTKRVSGESYVHVYND